MLEQMYMVSVIFVFWPVFFVYMYFFYEWEYRRLNFTLMVVGAFTWAMIWPVVLAVAAFKKYKA